MVGRFGEVQVMDWGLAKVLAPVGGGDNAAAMPAQQSVIETERSSGRGAASTAGSVLGTPAYMAPEQAQGEIALVDERSDVFGLGALLCEILTGKPAFTGRSSAEIIRKSARAELTDALTRLEASGAAAELIALATRCMAAERDERPRDAQEVATAISGYLRSVQERLRTAELDRVEAEARAIEERKRRKLAVALAASIVAIVGVSFGGWFWNERQLARREARWVSAFEEARVLYAQAVQAVDDLNRWRSAREAARQAERLLPDARGEQSRQRVRDLMEQIETATTAAEDDQRLLAKLESIRLSEYESGAEVTVARYATAFSDAGIVVMLGPLDEVAGKITSRSTAVRVALAAALDGWAMTNRDWTSSERILKITRLVDPDPWRNELRSVLLFREEPASRNKLLDLARLAKIDEPPVISIQLLAASLINNAELQSAERTLRSAQIRHPSDFWLNFTLANCLLRMSRPSEAIRYYYAARALRPEIGAELGSMLKSLDEKDEAIAVLKEMVRLRPDDVQHHVRLVVALKEANRAEELQLALKDADELAEKLRRKNPEDRITRWALGYLALMQEKATEAESQFRKAIEIAPNESQHLAQLGEALLRKDDTRIALPHSKKRLGSTPMMPGLIIMPG